METVTRSDGSSIAVEIATAVASARDEDVESLPPIGNVCDPEALERLVDESEAPVTVTIRLYGCRVVVDSDGTVTATHEGRT